MQQQIEYESDTVKEEKANNYLLLKNELSKIELKIDLVNNSKLFEKIINLYFKNDNNSNKYEDNNYTIEIWKNDELYLKMYSHDSTKLNHLFQLFYSEILS